MNAMQKTLTAAVLAAASAGAFAASNDGLPANGTGTGVGDLIFAYEAADASASILWDLSDGANDLNFTDMLSATAFTISNPDVTAFMTANPGGRWNIFGLTNSKTSGTTSSILYNQAGLGVTVNGAINPNQPNGSAINGAYVEGRIDVYAQWVSNANTLGAFPDNGTTLAGASDLWAFSDPTRGSVLANQQATGLVGDTLAYWTILIDNTVTRGVSANATNALGRAAMFSQLGNFSLDAGGNLAYSTAPVPVPAAVWLMGSALAGLGAMRRRKA